MRFILLLLVFSLTATAQNFPGKRPELLLNKTVKIVPLSDVALHYKQGYEGFYSDEYMSEPYAENKSRKTRPDALTNRMLKVTAVEPYPLPGQLNHKIVLQDTITSEKLYYEFSDTAEAKGNYHFEVIGGLKYPPDFYCDYIEQQNGEAGTGQTFTATIAEGITVTKHIKGKGQNYTMEVRTVQTYISMVRGVILVTEDGRQIHKPDVQAEVLASVNDNLVYTATFDLTAQEVLLLGQSKVVSGKISKFEKTYTDGEKLKEMVNCLKRK